MADAVLVVLKDKKARGNCCYCTPLSLSFIPLSLPAHSSSTLILTMEMIHFDAILFPSDGRTPTLVELMTSPMAIGHHSQSNPSRMPHPEVHMDYIAEGLGPRAWKYQLVEALDGMNRKFANPYIIFYPIISRDGMPFPVNKSIRDIQGRNFVEQAAWRGNIVIAKYHDNPFTSMMNASMADFPILKNYLMTHGCPGM
ncbi:hypothetical protein PM082_001143 [Marasmius tenuissimus]|nr:hypothetical protein PM082_001143 [Marasmius tenuissimus]